MKSNYVIQAEINITKHPEWDFHRKYKELKEAYEKHNNMCYLAGDIIMIVPTSQNKPIKFIYEGNI